MSFEISADHQTQCERIFPVRSRFVFEGGIRRTPAAQVIPVAFDVVQLGRKIAEGDTNLETSVRIQLMKVGVVEDIAPCGRQSQRDGIEHRALSRIPRAQYRVYTSTRRPI